MKSKPDDRKENAAKTQKAITNTLCNMEAARDMMGKTDNEKMQKDFVENNKRRDDSLRDTRKEIKIESKNSQKGYE